jgi:hypothetical protein
MENSVFAKFVHEISKIKERKATIFVIKFASSKFSIYTVFVLLVKKFIQSAKLSKNLLIAKIFSFHKRYKTEN